MPPPIGECTGPVRSRTVLCGSIGVRIVFLHEFWTTKKLYPPVPVSQSHRCHYRSVVSLPIGDLTTTAMICHYRSAISHCRSIMSLPQGDGGRRRGGWLFTLCLTFVYSLTSAQNTLSLTRKRNPIVARSHKLNNSKWPVVFASVDPAARSGMARATTPTPAWTSPSS